VSRKVRKQQNMMLLNVSRAVRNGKAAIPCTETKHLLEIQSKKGERKVKNYATYAYGGHSADKSEG